MWEVVEIEKQPRQLEGQGLGLEFSQRGGAALACWRVVPVPGPVRPGKRGSRTVREGKLPSTRRALTLASRTAGRRRRARDGGLRTGRTPSQCCPPMPPSPTRPRSRPRPLESRRPQWSLLRSSRVRVASVGLIICHSVSNRQHHRPELSNHSCTKKWAKKSNGRWQSHENLLTPPLVKTVALPTVRARSNATIHLLDPHRFARPSSSNANWLRKCLTTKHDGVQRHCVLHQMESFSLFLFYPSADTREQHPTSMTCVTSSRSDDDDDDDSNNNNPFPCRHHQAGVTRGPLPRSNKASSCPRETTISQAMSRNVGRWKAPSQQCNPQATSNASGAQLAFVEPFRALKGAVLLCARRQEELGICSGPRVSSLLSRPRGPPIFFVRSMQPASGYRRCKTEAH